MQNTKTIKLSDCEVVINDSKLNWGQKETLKLYYLNGYADDNGVVQAVFNPERMMDTRCKRIEYAVVEIKKGDIKIPFSKEWVFGLSSEDGKILYDAINEIDTKKKEQSAEKKLSENENQAS